MKIPALRATIGDWEYYVTTLTFEQVSTNVSLVDDFHQSEGLKDLIQRSITDNYLSIKEYIIHQPEVFFNSLVLAVYDNYPDWREIAFTYEDMETYKMGILEFTETHKIFAVDGQHRVKGIMAAIEENPNLKTQQIAAIFIGHKNDESGKKRTRRLFTTLNRYAKPVKDDDIIALDEDDLAAIETRELLEEYPLFTGSRVVYAKQKAIPNTNKSAITSIITLYQANIELLKFYLLRKEDKKPTAKGLETFCKFRPENAIVQEFKVEVIEFWNAFQNQIDILKQYLEIQENPATNFRNNDDGGNLIFRPIGFLPLIKTAILIKQRTGLTYIEIFTRFNTLNFNLSARPWVNVLWSPIGNKMIMSSSKVAEFLLLYLFDPALLSAKELNNLKEDYAAKISVESREQIDSVLDNLV
jgi:DNA sulfur modification protein DndB